MPPVTNAPKSTADRQIERAKQLERERFEVMERIGKNRTYLRLMRDNAELSDAQIDWLDDFYPEKVKDEQRTKDEIERTRKAKEEARKNGEATATA